MASLEITSDTLKVSLVSQHLEVVTRQNTLDGELVEKTDIPLFDIDRVIVSGRPNITMPTLISFMEEGIPVFFVSAKGKWRGSLTPDNNLNASRRICQYRRSIDSPFSLKISRALVSAKLRNSRRVLQRLAANRQQSFNESHQQACDELKHYSKLVQFSAHSIDEIRGYEGIGAAIYFAELSKYFPETMPFESRSRRPPKNPANALLSWAYTIIFGEMDSAVRRHGLDAGIGCLHCDKYNTPSLPLDLMEPLRPSIVDLLVLNIANHSMLKSDLHFEVNDADGGIYLNAEGRKAFFRAYEQVMNRKFSVERGGIHVDFRKVIDEQVCQYIRVLENDEDPEFFILP